MKKILGCLLILALAVTCINIPVKADEPTGMWVLTGHRENIKEAVNDEYWQYELGYDYNESKGKVICSKLIKLTNIDGHFESTFIAECTIPKATVKPGEYLQVDVNTYVEGSNLDNMLCSNSGRVHVYDFDVPFRDVNDYSKHYITTGTGPNSLKQDSATVQYDFPSYNLKDGDIIEIQFYQASGNSTTGFIGTIWTYTYRENYQSAPGKAAIKSAKVKKNTLTVTAKSQKCDGYQIQVSNSKDFDANSETTLNTLNYYGTAAKATFDNRMLNKTKYIRVRAFYKNGDSVTFGEWSNVKKLTK